LQPAKQRGGHTEEHLIDQEGCMRLVQLPHSTRLTFLHPPESIRHKCAPAAVIGCAAWKARVECSEGRLRGGIGSRDQRKGLANLWDLAGLELGHRIHWYDFPAGGPLYKGSNSTVASIDTRRGQIPGPSCSPSVPQHRRRSGAPAAWNTLDRTSAGQTARVPFSCA
jgi:hypothetical protein